MCRVYCNSSLSFLPLNFTNIISLIYCNTQFGICLFWIVNSINCMPNCTWCKGVFSFIFIMFGLNQNNSHCTHIIFSRNVKKKDLGLFLFFLKKLASLFGGLVIFAGSFASFCAWFYNYFTSHQTGIRVLRNTELTWVTFHPKPQTDRGRGCHGNCFWMWIYHAFVYCSLNAESKWNRMEKNSLI